MTSGLIQTHSGQMVSPFNPDPATLTIQDIAHALSHICRFTGHTDKFYCPTPDQRVLTDRLEWVPVETLKVGDGLVAFDEQPFVKGAYGKNRRRLRHAIVTDRREVKRQIIRLELEDGSSVTTSDEHPWLVATKASGNQKWVTARDIASSVNSGGNRHMHKFFPPWDYGASREHGWLAGIYDGEGSLSFTGRTGTQLSVAQRRGPVLNEMDRIHHLTGFGNFSYNYNSISDVENIQLKGGVREIMRFLGTYQPIRLIAKFHKGLNEGYFDKQLQSDGNPIKIVKAHEEGEQWVSGMSTSTHTYFCEGFGAHNCVAEHSVRVARLVPSEDRLAALLHDATEAYLCDIATPIKAMLPGYTEAEDRLARVIADKWGVAYPWPESVHKADRIMLHSEARELMGDPEWARGGEVVEMRMVGWEPWYARMTWLDMVEELIK